MKALTIFPVGKKMTFEHNTKVEIFLNCAFHFQMLFSPENQAYQIKMHSIFIIISIFINFAVIVIKINLLFIHLFRQ